jgi:hypothetical protein
MKRGRQANSDEEVYTLFLQGSAGMRQRAAHFFCGRPKWCNHSLSSVLQCYLVLQPALSPAGRLGRVPQPHYVKQRDVSSRDQVGQV